jgi:hypothetical protein
MRNREIVIRLQLPRWPRKRWLVGGLAACLCVGAIAYATVPNTFNIGDPLSSAKVNANFTSLDGRVSTLETVQPFVTVTPANDWSNASTGDSQLGYFKDPFGVVHLRGVIVEAANNRSTIMTLPSGLRPLKTLVVGVPCGTSASTVQLGLVDILTTGVVVPDNTCQTNNFVSLDSISFRGEQ